MTTKFKIMFNFKSSIEYKFLVYSKDSYSPFGVIWWLVTVVLVIAALDLWQGFFYGIG